MRRSAAVVVCMFCLAGVLHAADGYLSPSAATTDKAGKRLYIAESTARQVAVFDVASKKVERAIALPLNPTGLALSPDGGRLYVTGDDADGKVFVIDTSSGAVAGRIAVGHTPMAPVVSPDGRTLYVCNRFDNTVSVIDLASGKETAQVEAAREPVAAAVTPDGKLLFAANLLPTGAADGDTISAAVDVIDAATKKAVATIPLPNGSTGVRGICASPDGRHVYVTHVLARYHMPTTQLERGWMNTNALTIIDAPGRRAVNTVLLDDVDLGAANPWGVACTADGKHICVAHAGTHEVSVIDRAALHEKLDQVAKGGKVSAVSLCDEDVPNDLSFLVGIRRRLPLAGNGPRGLALAGTKAYAAEYFTDSIGIVDIRPEARPQAESIPLGPKRDLTPARKGEMFFHDAALCFQHWQSCSSCHPDGRSDGLNWDLLNDGMGNPKQTKSLLLAHKTPPSMMTGVRDNAEAAVRAGIRFIQFAVRPEEDAAAIDEYLKSLRPAPSPRLVNGGLSESARRGEQVFKTSGCGVCHQPPLYTDLEKRDVGTGRDLEKDKAFDTPTLIENWRTAPYLYDGRAATMIDLIRKHNAADMHGETLGLTAQQAADLAEFVLSQ